MGNCQSAKIEGCWDIDFAVTGIKSWEIAKLRKVFDSLNSDKKRDAVDIETILSAWDLVDSEICHRAFSLYSEDCKLKLVNFKEFVLLTWHLCILSQHSLGFFVLEFYDEYRRGMIYMPDVTKCLHMLKVSKDKIERYNYIILF